MLTPENVPGSGSGKTTQRSDTSPADADRVEKPLFSAAEQAQWKARFEEHERAYRTSRATWSDREALDREFLRAKRLKVEARPEEFTDALLAIVGSRGARYVELDKAFAHSGNTKMIAELAPHDTPENRRALHTLLKGLEEIPKSWAMSAYVRFLRGQGEQANPKYDYTGRGMFGKEFGWKGDEIKAVCALLMGGWRYSAYSDMLQTYADVASEIRADEEAMESGKGYAATFSAVRAQRNKKLIGLVCAVLEARGLGEEPKAEVKEPREPRKAKIFEPGDIIRQGTLRDLPLPAWVRVPIERNTDGDRFHGKWQTAEVEWVVTKLFNDGRAQCLRVGPHKDDAEKKVAYSAGRSIFDGRENKEFLYGGEFLGKWTGEIDQRNVMNYRFHYRRPGSEY